MDWEFECKLSGVELEVKGWRGLVTLTGLILMGAAVLQELRLPRGTVVRGVAGWYLFALVSPYLALLVRLWRPLPVNLSPPASLAPGSCTGWLSSRRPSKAGCQVC